MYVNYYVSEWQAADMSFQIELAKVSFFNKYSIKNINFF